MAESYVQVPEDSTGKKLKTWTGSGLAHSEAIVLTVADAIGTFIDPRLVRISGSDVTQAVSGSVGFTSPVGISGSITNTVAVTGSLSAITGSINNPITGSINNYPSTYPSTQSGNWNVGQSGSWKDSISSGANITTLTAQSGSCLINIDGTKKIKLFDAGMSPSSAGLHFFYFGTTTGSIQTKQILSCSGSGTFRQTFVYPRTSNAGDALYVMSTTGETGLQLDVNYIQE